MSFGMAAHDVRERSRKAESERRLREADMRIAIATQERKKQESDASKAYSLPLELTLEEALTLGENRTVVEAKLLQALDRVDQSKMDIFEKSIWLKARDASASYQKLGTDDVSYTCRRLLRFYKGYRDIKRPIEQGSFTLANKEAFWEKMANNTFCA